MIRPIRPSKIIAEASIVSMTLITFQMVIFFFFLTKRNNDGCLSNKNECSRLKQQTTHHPMMSELQV